MDSSEPKSFTLKEYSGLKLIQQRILMVLLDINYGIFIPTDEIPGSNKLLDVLYDEFPNYTTEEIEDELEDLLQNGWITKIDQAPEEIEAPPLPHYKILRRDLAAILRIEKRKNPPLEP